MKKILGLSMAMLMIASCAVGCGDNGDGGSSKKSKKSNFVGKWEAEKIVDENGTEMTEFFGIPLASAFQFEFKEDGSVIVSEQLAELSDSDEETPTGSWKADGSKVTITVPSEETGEDESIDFEYKDEKLVAEDFEDGTEGALYLVKVDEFTTFDFESLANSFDLSGLELDEDSFDFSDSDFDFGSED